MTTDLHAVSIPRFSRSPLVFSPMWAVLWTAVILLGGAVPARSQDPASKPVEQTGDPCVDGPALYRNAQFGAARRNLRECLDRSGDRVEILMPLVVMGVREERVDEALAYGVRAVAADSNDAEARYWYGRGLLLAGRTEEAKTQWNRGLQENLGHFGILEGLARLAIQEDEPTKAYQLLSQMKVQGMHEVWLERMMADIAASRGLWRQALSHLEEAIVLDGETVQDYLTSSELSILAGDKESAVRFCRRAVEIEPGAASYGGLGEAFFSLEEMDSTLVYLRKALEFEGDTARFRFNLANALEVTGRTEEAGQQFRFYLELQPSDPVGHFNYAIHLNKQGRPADALVEVTRAVELDWSMLTARVVKIQIQESMGLWDAALNDLTELQELDPASEPELKAWRDQILAKRDQAQAAGAQGKIHLLHMLIPGLESLTRVQELLAAGEDFGQLVVRFSGGPSAGRGGDIGWINPADMMPEIRSALENLEINEISPPIESQGLYHIFKRIP